MAAAGMSHPTDTPRLGDRRHLPIDLGPGDVDPDTMTRAARHHIPSRMDA